MSATADTTHDFGRGVVLLALANVVYIVGGYGLTVVLAHTLGAEDFGGYGVVTAYITVLTTLLVKGLPGAVTRAIADGAVAPPVAFRAGRQLLSRAAVGLVLIGVAASPLAARLLGETDLAPLLAIGALGAATFGVNAILLAWAVGTRDYRRQAMAQVAYSLLRVLFVLVGAALAGLTGAVVGYVLAPLASSVPLWQRHAAVSDGAAVRACRSTLRRAAVPVVVTAIAVTSYFVVDVFALTAAVGGTAPAVGAYVAFGTLAHVPFFLLQATSVAMVPAIAAAARGVARRTAIRTTLTDTLVLLGGPTALLVTAGDAAARAVFGSGYDVAGSVVAPLAVATALITVHAGLVAVDTAVGRLAPTVALSFLGVSGVAIAAYVAAERADQLQAASAVAWAVLGVATVLVLLHLALETRRFGWIVDARRAGLATAVALVAAVPPLVVADSRDVVVMAVAALCGLAWLATISRLGLINLRRARPDAETVATEV